MLHRSWFEFQRNHPHPPCRHVFHGPSEKKHCPQRGRHAVHAHRSMHTGQRFQDSLILHRLSHLLDCLRRAAWKLYRQGLTGDIETQLHHVPFRPSQENLFLVDPACFLPLLRHMIFMVGLLVYATSVVRDPRLTSELTTAVRAW